MKLISEPAIAIKISKMKHRVRWKHRSVIQMGIDQTRMVLDDGKQDQGQFSFMVMGDTGTRSTYTQHPQRLIAESMLKHRDDCAFTLHTGDVIYVVGSSEYYPQNFIEPYREFLFGGENHRSIRYDRMLFEKPILPVLGNHDYYDVPWIYRLVAGSTKSLRKLLKYKDSEIGWHGSNQGDAFARAFIDYLAQIPEAELAHHFDSFYNAKTDTGRVLRYLPGFFTRIPNRYYTFSYGGIDFFALDSNTFNVPTPIPHTREGDATRHQLEKRRQQIEQEEVEIITAIAKLDRENPEHTEQLEALTGKLNQIDEIKIDIEKQLQEPGNLVYDTEQLEWLTNRLIASWQNPEIRGRVLYFHHPPFVTEATKWHQAQTLAVRHRLREVFDNVERVIGKDRNQRPIVDLILNGHAHCLEYLTTADTGHADRGINCLVCGGSGHRPRRQREDNNQLMEVVDGKQRKVADSHLFVGCNGYNSKRRLPYSFVRIDVKDGTPPRFIVRPYVWERYQKQWFSYELDPFEF